MHFAAASLYVSFHIEPYVDAGPINGAQGSFEIVLRHATAGVVNRAPVLCHVMYRSFGTYQCVLPFERGIDCASCVNVER